jgi:oligopeptide transport system ATP-binding protein
MDSGKQSAAGHADAILEVRNLSKHYLARRPLSRARPKVEAFSNVNLSVRRGATLAVVGESGAGKSTLARCLALLERPTQGEIFFAGQDLLTLRRRQRVALHRQIQMIFQDPTSALNPRLTAAELIAEPLEVQRIGTPPERRERALELLKQVGLSTGSEQKRSFEFSGGQRQRIAIARALALQPSLLILDEALASLDVANQHAILSLLAELQSALSLTYIHVSHDLRLVSQFAAEVAVLHRGSIVEHRTTADLFSAPAHPYTHELLCAQRPLASLCAERLEKSRRGRAEPEKVLA